MLNKNFAVLRVIKVMNGQYWLLNDNFDCFFYILLNNSTKYWFISLFQLAVCSFALILCSLFSKFLKNSTIKRILTKHIQCIRCWWCFLAFVWWKILKTRKFWKNCKIWKWSLPLHKSYIVPPLAHLGVKNYIFLQLDLGCTISRNNLLIT